MRKKQVVCCEDWDFDGETIVVTIPMAWKRRGGRKVIVAPNGGDAWAPAKGAPRRDADPRAGAGASVEEVVGGREVWVGG